MLLNKKGFILYDAIVSFMLLSSTLIFFNQIIYINSQFDIKNDNKQQIINQLYKKIDNKDIVYDTKGVTIIIEEKKYCGVKDEQKICIFK